MTIPNVTAGQTIAPSWGNAVADQLNDLPVAIQTGAVAPTFTSGDSTSISFPSAFASAPVIHVQIIAVGTTANWSWSVKALSASAFTVRLYSNGSVYTGSAVTVHWMASGALA